MKAILFPGQGAQAVGMGHDFHEASSASREVFERADEALGFSLSKVCFEGPESKLEETDVCQPAIFTCSAAIVAALREHEGLSLDEFAFAAGLSLGEYTALWFAEALDFEDALRLVRARGQAMQMASERCPSGMASLLGADADQVRALCEQHAQGEVLGPANFLATGNIAVSGSEAALERLLAGAKDGGARRAVALKVAGAFHSELMQPAVGLLEEAMAVAKWRSPRIEVLSNVTGLPHGEATEAAEDGDVVPAVRRGLLMQVTSPVRWEDSMQSLLARGVEQFLEPGPGGVLSGLMRKIDRAASCRNVKAVADLEGAQCPPGGGVEGTQR